MNMPRRTAPSIIFPLKLLTAFLTISAVVAFLLLALFAGVSSGQTSHPPAGHQPASAISSAQPTTLLPPPPEAQIAISPTHPNSDDVVNITISGIWSNSCRPVYQSHQVTNNIIRIDAKATGNICLSVLTPWAVSVAVGPFAAGLYRVDAYVTTSSGLFIYQYTTFFTVTTANVSQIITSAGGELTQRYPGHSTTLTVPPGALSAPSLFTLSYQLPPTSTGQLMGMDHFFAVTGSQTTFTTPVTLTLRYSETALGPIIAGTETLYRLQNGEWVTDEITITARFSGGLSAQTTRLSSFGILGESKHVYLPVIDE